MEVTSVQIAFVALIITAITGLFAIFRAVNSIADKLRGEFQQQMDRVEKSINTQLDKLDAETERLKRESVRREDLAMIEARLTGAIAKLDVKLDAKVDALVDRIDHRLDLAIRRLEGIKP